LFEAYGYALVPIIIALVQVAKRMGLALRYLPFLAIVLGIAASYFYVFPEHPKRAVLEGIVMGLSAVGLWSGIKNTFASK
jgi:L-lactate permease